jgi:uncharacterized protein (DUF488 family)
MNTKEVYTIGYEGLGIPDFIGRLKAHSITRLIDVREIPLSRKRGFSKSQLKKLVESEDIEYVHMRSLGSPTIIRLELKKNHNYDQFFLAFSDHLSKNLDSITTLHKYIQDGINCIMCFERFPEKCHRSVIAKKIKEYSGNELKISHI